jgi:hypothetical protein
VYRIILGPVYDNEKENWRILTNKDIYAIAIKPTVCVTETVSLHRLHWHVKSYNSKKSVIYEFGNKIER